MKLAMEELRFYCQDGEVTILGTYPATLDLLGRNSASSCHLKFLFEQRSSIFPHIGGGRLGGRGARSIRSGPRKQPRLILRGSSSLPLSISPDAN